MRRNRSLLPVLLAVVIAGGLATASPTAQAADRPWLDAAQTPTDRANELLAQMTETEKLAMMHQGASCTWGACVDGNTRLGIPALHLQDGPAGVADGVIGVTQLPAPVAGAATWDTSLMQQYGQVIGSEEWGKGANVNLGPTINIDRDPRWGRSFESLSEDPYLAAQLGTADVQGVQSQGPMVQLKHYAVYNQETYRNTTQDDAVVSDRAEQEIYLPAFQAAVQQGKADSVMCSYAEVNGTFACENGTLLNTELKQDLGFSGFVTSDWGGTHSTVASANNGLDMEMTGDTFYGDALTQAVANGQVSQATIDDHVRRILVSMFTAGLFDTTQTGTTTSTVTSAAHTAVAKQVAEEGSVLLKNSTSTLPITSATKSIAVIGDDAGPNAMTAGNGSAHVNAPYVVTPYQGIKARAGSAATVSYAQGNASPNGEIVDGSVLTPSQGGGTGLYAQYYNGTSLSGTPIVSKVDPNVDFNWGGLSPTAGVPATSWSAKWTGTITPPSTGTYTFSLTSDDGSRLFVNGQQVISNWADQPATTKTGTITLTAGQAASIEVDYFQDGGGSQVNLGWQIPNQNLDAQAVTAAKAANLAVVFVDNAEGEGADLPNIDLSADQNQLVSDVAAANPNTVVVVNSGSAVTMPWANSVKGIIENWYPGQEDGNAIAALLYGDANFSGKLPVTFPQSLADVPAHTTAQWPGQNSNVQYSEGIDVGYRWYDSQNKTPLFPFGFGLSYTTFGYNNLTVSTPDASGNVAVGFDVTNTGTRAGSEVAQVYVGQPAATGEPPKNLRGFQRVTLDPGASQHVSVTLDARSFQYWNNGWTNATGANAISVGSSSRDIRLTGQVTIGSGGGGTGGTQTALPRTGWTASASASSTTDVPAHMLDGDSTTRWTTGVGEAAGQYVTIDMGSTKSFDQITMDSAASTGDYARGYQVLVSTDGTNWSAPVASGTGSTPLITATFPTQNARYVRVVQTGSNSLWWSIAEFNVYTSGGSGTTPPPANTNLAAGKTATASGSSQTYAPANADDGDTGTYWESTNNAFPQWLQVDLGAATTVGRVVLTLPPSTSWGARTQTLSVQGSTDGSTFTTLAGSAGYTFDPNTGNKVTITVPSSSQRYLRLNITGNTGWPAGQVSEFQVYAS
jgi:beta-glucosidase